MSQVFNRNITKDQSRDTGMAMVLLALVLFFVYRRNGFILAATVLHVVNMVVPQIYRPVAVVWLGLSHVLGTVMSKVLLSIAFFLVVTPVAIIRRMLGKDSLKLRAFKASEESVMVERNHTFGSRDMERPF